MTDSSTTGRRFDTLTGLASIGQVDREFSRSWKVLAQRYRLKIPVVGAALAVSRNPRTRIYQRSLSRSGKSRKTRPCAHEAFQLDHRTGTYWGCATMLPIR